MEKNGSSERIIIIDDSQESLEMLTVMLERKGYAVFQALGGRIGLKIAEKAEPDLIILDIKMPEMDGYETCRRLKQNPKLQNVPVIFISGLEETMNIVKAFESGGVDYIIKPFQSEEILARIKNHLSLRSMQEELEEQNIKLQKEIAEREEAEDALRKSQARYKNLFNNMLDGVAVYEAVDDGEDFIFVEFNKAGAEIDNVKIKELIGKKVTETFPGVKEFGLFEVFQRVWKTGKSEHCPIAVYKDERITGWRENFVYKLPSGEIVAVYSDETLRKQSEEALQEAYDQLEQRVEERTAELAKANDHLMGEIEDRERPSRL